MSTREKQRRRQGWGDLVFGWTLTVSAFVVCGATLWFYRGDWKACGYAIVVSILLHASAAALKESGAKKLAQANRIMAYLGRQRAVGT